jgi:hypothetical protein
MDYFDLDMDCALIAYQSGHRVPSHLARIAELTLGRGEVGPATAAIAALVGSQNDEIEPIIESRFAELLEENGGEVIPILTPCIERLFA